MTVTGLTVDLPEILPLVVLPPIIIWWLWHRRRIPVVSRTAHLGNITPSLRHHAFWRVWAIALSAMLTIVASALPRLHWQTHCPARTRLNLALVIDMSGSMEASDWPEAIPVPSSLTADIIPPSRLETAKEQLKSLLAAIPPARCALLGFAQNTILVSPLSEATPVLLERLAMLRTDHFDDGTAIGQALDAAVASLKFAPDGPRAIVLFSDGVDHAPVSPELSAMLAAHEDIVIHTVGLGGSHALHPIATDDGVRWEAVGEPLDMSQLSGIAAATGGHAFQAQDSIALAQAVTDITAKLSDRHAHQVVQKSCSMALPLLAAALLVFLVTALVSRPASDV